MSTTFDIAPARKLKGKIKAPLAADPVFAPSEDEAEFWDTLTTPLLAVFQEEADGLNWVGVEAACDLVGIKERFVLDAIAYLQNMGRVHLGTGETPRWFYGPGEEL